jgi:hypothetical protein
MLSPQAAPAAVSSTAHAAERSRLVALERHTALLALSFLDPSELARCTRLCKRWALPYHHMLWRAHCAAAGMDVQNQSDTKSAVSTSTSTTADSAPKDSKSAPSATIASTAPAADARFYYRTYCEAARHLVLPIAFPPATARLIDIYTAALGPSLFRRCRVMCAPNAVTEAHHLIAVLLAAMFPAPAVSLRAAKPKSTEWVEVGIDGTKWRRFERWSVVCSKIVQSHSEVTDSYAARQAWEQSRQKKERRSTGWHLHLASLRTARLVRALWGGPNWPDPNAKLPQTFGQPTTFDLYLGLSPVLQTDPHLAAATSASTTAPAHKQQQTASDFRAFVYVSLLRGAAAVTAADAEELLSRRFYHRDPFHTMDWCDVAHTQLKAKAANDPNKPAPVDEQEVEYEYQRTYPLLSLDQHMALQGDSEPGIAAQRIRLQFSQPFFAELDRALIGVEHKAIGQWCKTLPAQAPGSQEPKPAVRVMDWFAGIDTHDQFWSPGFFVCLSPSLPRLRFTAVLIHSSLLSLERWR